VSDEAADRPARPRRKVAKEGPFAGSTRYYRGRIIAALRAVPPDGSLDLACLGRQVKPDFGDGDLPWLAELVRRLAGDGLLEVSGGEDPAAWRVALPA
jgi:A/G-specific adenine glycosylase